MLTNYLVRGEIIYQALVNDFHATEGKNGEILFLCVDCLEYNVEARQDKTSKTAYNKCLSCDHKFGISVVDFIIENGTYQEYLTIRETDMKYLTYLFNRYDNIYVRKINSYCKKFKIAVS